MKLNKFMLLFLTFVLVAYADAPIYGYFWLRYTYDNPTAPADVTTNVNYFAIERGYIRWKTSTAPVSVSGTIDVAMKAKATNASDWNVRLKYAQADWLLPGVGDYLPDTKLTLGVQKVCFGIMELWEYPVIEKSIEEVSGKMNSADLGLGLSGLLPSGYGDFALQVFNGNGYTKATEDNEKKSVSGSLSLIPIPGIMLKGSYWKNTVGPDSLLVKVDRYAGAIKFNYGPVAVFGEYFGSKDGAVDGVGYMAFMELTLNRLFSLLGRYDIWDADKGKDDDAYKIMIGGINYNISNVLLAQLNYQRKKYEDTTKEDEDKVMLQFKY